MKYMGNIISQKEVKADPDKVRLSTNSTKQNSKRFPVFSKHKKQNSRRFSRYFNDLSLMHRTIACLLLVEHVHYELQPSLITEIIVILFIRLKFIMTSLS